MAGLGHKIKPVKICEVSRKYYYKRLKNAEQRRLYRFMLACIRAHIFKFIYVPSWYEEMVGTPPPNDIPALYEKNAGSHAEFYIEEIYKYILYDFPEIFYTTQMGGAKVEPNLVINVSIPEKRARFSEREIQEIQRKMDEIYHTFDGVEDGYPLLEAINNYLTEKYDYIKEGPNWERGKRRHAKFTPASFIKWNEGVCWAFTRFAQYILERRGMEAVSVFENMSDEKNMGHIWLAVKLDGEYYHIDITYNNTQNNAQGATKYMSFNITDEERIEQFPDYNPKNHPGIRCTATKYNYYVYHGIYYTNADELKCGFRKFLEDNDTVNECRYFYFKIKKGSLCNKEIGQCMREVLEGRTLKHYQPRAVLNYYLFEIQTEG